MSCSSAVVALLSVLVLSSLLPLCSSLPYQSRVTVGVLWPASVDARSVSLPLEMALSDLALSSIAPNPSIRLVYADSNTTQIGVTAALVRLNNQLVGSSSPLIAAIGGYTDTLSQALGAAATALPTPVPVVSPALTSLTTSTDTAGSYRYMLRTSVTDSLLAAGMQRLISANNWTRLAVLHSDDDVGRGFSTALLQLCTNLSVTLYAIPTLSLVQINHAISNALTRLMAQDNYVFVLHSSQPAAVLRYAYQLGLLSAPRTWLGTTLSCTDDTVAALADLSPQAMAGFTCVTDGVVQSANGRWAAFAQRLVLAAPDLYPTVDAVPALSGYLYDALWTVAQGVYSLTQTADVNTGSSLLLAMLQANFTGVTGQLVWPSAILSTPCSTLSCSVASLNPAAGDRQSAVLLKNWDAVAAGFVVRGTVSPSALVNVNVTVAAQISTWSDVVWAGGSSATPKDRPRVYAQGDALPTESDQRLVVLSYAIGVFGAWTALILLEQAISLRQQHWMRQRQQLLKGAAGRSVTSAPGWRSWGGWLSAAALALSCGCVWPSLYIDAASVSADTVSLSFSAAPFVASLLLAGLTLLSFALFVSDVRLVERVKGENSSLVESSDGLSSEGSRLHSTLGSVTHAASSSSDPASTSDSHKQRRRQRQQQSTLRWKLLAMLRVLGWRSALASVVLAAAVIVQLELTTGSVVGPVRVALSAGAKAGAYAAAVAVFAVPALLMFHLSTSRVRFLSAFLFSALVQAVWAIVRSGVSIAYQPSTSPSGPLVDASETTALIIAGAALALCLLLMAANVAGLRGARRLIDFRLKQTDAQHEQAKRRVDEQMAVVAERQKQAELARKLLEGVNLCRPLYRSYALALALADVDEAAVAPAGDNQHVKGGAGTDDERMRTAVLARQLLLPASGEDSLSAGNSGARDEPSGAAATDTGSREANSAFAAEAEASKPSRGAHSTSAAPSAASTYSSNSSAPSSLFVCRQSDFQLVHRCKQESMVLQLLDELTALLDSPARVSLLHSSQQQPSVSASSHTQTAAALSLRQATWAEVLRLPHLLSHPLCVELLKDACARTFTPENLALHAHISEYKATPDTALRQARMEAVTAAFIANGAKHEVNLSASMKEALLREMDRSPGAVSLFDQVGAEVVKLVLTNNADAFNSSPAFLTAVLYAALVHPTAATAPTGMSRRVSELMYALQHSTAQQPTAAPDAAAVLVAAANVPSGRGSPVSAQRRAPAYSVSQRSSPTLVAASPPGPRYRVPLTLTGAGLSPTAAAAAAVSPVNRSLFAATAADSSPPAAQRTVTDARLRAESVAATMSALTEHDTLVEEEALDDDREGPSGRGTTDVE